MTAVILWKEYRQQRAIWLAIALLAVLLAIVFGATLGHGSGLQVFQEQALRDGLTVVVFILAIAYGVVGGALLLAGECDDGTLTFLDTLTGRREPLWDRKCLAGVILTLTQSFALLALGLGLGFIPWRFALLLPFAALDAFAWGLLGGALCQRVLSGVLTGVAFMACSWVVIPVAEGGGWIVIVEAALAVMAGYMSRRYYTGVDRLRKSRIVRPSKHFFSIVPASMRVLWWLSFRQGHWVLIACVGGTILLAFNVQRGSLVVWPLATLALGLACGLSVFVFDQNEGSHFLGTQRFAPGTIWTIKVFFWVTVLVGLSSISWLLNMGLGNLLDPSSYTQEGIHGDQWTDELRDRMSIVSSLLFFLLPLYGFCYGQFFGQVARRPVLAVFLAVSITLLVLAAWAPSLLIGGVPLWQVLIAPVVLLLLTRSNQWPWMAGRLMTFRPLAINTVGWIFTIIVIAVCLWYRAVEVPEVDEPFDVAAFVASLPPPENNEAGQLIRAPGAEMREQRSKATEQVPPPQPLFPKEIAPAQPGGAPGASAEPTWASILNEVVQSGWPLQDEELSRWLDRLFEGRWVKDAEAAARLPLGLIDDPRRPQPEEQRKQTIQDSQNMATYFVVRALQLQARGDFRTALKYLETTLALSRQVKHDAPLAYLSPGDDMEVTALVGLHFWLMKVGPNRELLHDALTMLQRHQAAIPDLVNSVKVQYLIDRERVPSFPQNSGLLNDLLAVARQVPWEKERQRRISRAIYRAGVALQIQESQLPNFANAGSLPFSSAGDDRYRVLAAIYDLPPKEGPGSQLAARKWGEFIEQFEVERASEYRPDTVFWPTTARSRLQLNSTLLITAVALYQAEHGIPPPKLDELIPHYLEALPTNPWTGQSFGYRVSAGEIIDSKTPPLKLSPGQAVLFTEHRGGFIYYPVPLWTK